MEISRSKHHTRKAGTRNKYHTRKAGARSSKIQIIWNFRYWSLVIFHLSFLFSCSRQDSEEESRSPSVEPVSGREVIQRVNGRPRGRDSIKEVTMRLVGED